MWGALRHSNEILPRGFRGALSALLIAGFALRFAIAWHLPNLNHPDEVYQVAEQANRSIRGYGIVPWEFRTASRGVMLTTLVKPIYWLTATPATQQFLQQALFCALSLIPVWIAFHWAARLYGLRGGILAAVMMATWFELVYFSPKPTIDAVGSYFLLAALFLSRPAARPIAVGLAGVSLMIALAIRVQLAPAAGVVFVVAALSKGRGRRAAFASGIVAGSALAGAVEWSWWGVPFQGQRRYLMMEFVHHASQFFGREPGTFYVEQYAAIYGIALPAIAYLVWVGAKKAPILLVITLAAILPFQFVGHKEYRFVVAGVPTLVLLMGLGASDLIARFEHRGKSGTVAVLVVGWVAAMIAMGAGPTYRRLWTNYGNYVLAFRDIGADQEACGVALVGVDWWQTPGYSGLGRNLPIYEIRQSDQADRIRAAANYVLVSLDAVPPAQPYARWRAYPRPLQYVYRRPGGCVPYPTGQITRPPGIPGVE